MQKTKIDWCDSTWNPVTGCFHNCEYCYAKRIATRFGGNAMNTLHILDTPYVTKGKVQPYPFGFVPTLHRYRMSEYENKTGRNIFVCSMADLFGEWVPEDWIKEVFTACEKAPQHNYLFLTKNPSRYTVLENDKKLPWADNFWFGSSITKQSDKYTWFTEKKFHWFLSVEPLLEELGQMEPDAPKPEWVIIGAETGNRKDKVIPKKEWIENLISECRIYNIPVFMKSSLEEIWEAPLVQEFPEKLMEKR